METRYQIVFKGIPSNKIYIKDTNNYDKFKKDLKYYQNQKTYYTILTTNQYYIR